MNSSQFFVPCLILLLIVAVYCEYEGSPCSNNDGTTGMCRLIHNCPAGMEMLRKNYRHTLHRCGFKDFDEIVCCPDDGEEESNEINKTETTTNRVNTVNPTQSRLKSRKSVAACDEFIKKSETRLTWHIINGINAEDGEFPHMAALGYLSDEGTIKWDCGGSLIAPRFVLTAAHCIVTRDSAGPTKVRLGEIDLTNEGSTKKQDIDVVGTRVHPEYNIKGRLNDIGILKLKQDAVFTKNVQPSCLYTENDDPIGLIITGWGVIDSNMQTSWKALQKSTILPSNLKDCTQVYRARVNKEITKKQICAADPGKVNTTDTCQGDSGGPLQIENLKDSSLYTIVGVTSYGMGCGTNFPSVYTRVSAYLDFIEAYVWPD